MPKNNLWLSNPAYILKLTLSKNQDKIIAVASNGSGYEYAFNTNNLKNNKNNKNNKNMESQHHE
jgi:hypothetical protein